MFIVNTSLYFFLNTFETLIYVLYNLHARYKSEGYNLDKKSAIINEIIKYYAGDVKRINHFMKVYSFAKTIGEIEHIDNEKQEVLEIAAIVHDIGIKLSEQKYGVFAVFKANGNLS